MAQKKSCPYPTPFSEPLGSLTGGVGVEPGDKGWVLAFVLLLLVVIQGLMMASLSLATYHLKSSTAFYHLIKNTHFSSGSSAPPSGTQTRLMAPEGWDHTRFSTELRELTLGNVRSYSWRVALGDFPDSVAGEVMLAAARPHIVVIVDDSQTMNTSSGKDYAPDALYLRRTSGEIVRVSAVSEIDQSSQTPEGTYFTGSHGNSFFRAPPSEAGHGAMPSWTLAHSSARSLVDSLELCEVAVMSASGGMIQPFTHDRQALARALDGIHPTSAEAHLAETLHQALGVFPPQCISERHVLIVTSGVAVNDGNLPGWLQDFDCDGNTRDTSIREAGSHCLDDVAAYAKSLGIRVHVMGPDTPFLQGVAAKGAGLCMPARNAFVPGLSFVCQPMAMFAARELMSLHRTARFAPPWLESGTCTPARTGVLDPLALVAYPDLPVTGLARHMTSCGSSMFLSTTQDQLLKIALPTGELSWLIAGIGGAVLARGDRVIAGPDSRGMITCISQQPSIIWTRKADLAAASGSTTYLSMGSSIAAHRLDTGAFITAFDTGHTITALEYDACTGVLLAGTRDGLICFLSQGLEQQGIAATGISDSIREIRPFTWRKKLHLLVAGRSSVACCTEEGSVWSVSLDEGAVVGCTVMDAKAYVSAWQEGAPCTGIDTGTSVLISLDALTGERSGVKTLCAGKAFGPTIDLAGRRMVFVSWSSQVLEEDISGMAGVTWRPAGRRFLRQGE